MQLVRPAQEYLGSYIEALQKGWTPDGLARPDFAQQELALIEADAAAFLESLDDPQAKGAPIKLPDGSLAPRIPGYNRWMWDGEFAGRIDLRWQNGTMDLPPHCLGHIGYAVVPWKQRQGYATKALALMLENAKAQGLPYVEITTDQDNFASQKVIAANGGVLVGEFTKPVAFGGKPSFRFRMALS